MGSNAERAHPHGGERHNKPVPSSLDGKRGRRPKRSGRRSAATRKGQSGRGPAAVGGPAWAHLEGEQDGGWAVLTSRPEGLELREEEGRGKRGLGDSHMGAQGMYRGLDVFKSCGKI